MDNEEVFINQDRRAPGAPSAPAGQPRARSHPAARRAPRPVPACRGPAAPGPPRRLPPALFAPATSHCNCEHPPTLPARVPHPPPSPPPPKPQHACRGPHLHRARHDRLQGHRGGAAGGVWVGGGEGQGRTGGDRRAGFGFVWQARSFECGGMHTARPHARSSLPPPPPPLARSSWRQPRPRPTTAWRGTGRRWRRWCRCALGAGAGGLPWGQEQRSHSHTPSTSLPPAPPHAAPARQALLERQALTGTELGELLEAHGGGGGGGGGGGRCSAAMPSHARRLRSQRPGAPWVTIPLPPPTPAPSPCRRRAVWRLLHRGLWLGQERRAELAGPARRGAWAGAAPAAAGGCSMCRQAGQMRGGGGGLPAPS